MKHVSIVSRPDEVSLQDQYSILYKEIFENDMKDLRLVSTIGTKCYKYLDDVLEATKNGNRVQRDFKRLSLAMDLINLFEQEVRRDECSVSCGTFGGMRVICRNGHSTCKDCYSKLKSIPKKNRKLLRNIGS